MGIVAGSTGDLYLHGLVGGLVLGCMAASRILLVGNVFGCSGIVKAMLKCKQAAPFVLFAGMVSGAFIARAAAPSTAVEYIGVPNWALFLMGLVVGVGTYFANGCTSGHGITGTTRLSKRSIVATAVFFVTGLVTATATDSRSWLTANTDWAPMPWVAVAYTSLGAIGCLIVLAILGKNKVLSDKVVVLMVDFVVGAGFSFGLVISGMNRPTIVLDFLNLRGFSNSEWNGALACVLGGAILVCVILYYGYGIHSHETTFLGEKVSLPSLKGAVDARLVVGSFMFGIGWGLSGICPGPGVTLLAYTNAVPGLCAYGGIILGQVVGSAFDRFKTPREKITTASEDEVPAKNTEGIP
uniref:Sulphur transport domain-containing protein n=1 Tax=Mucochytrium quahogii TaxID=96639 RepID=A0A7S2S234_9STRA|mmetsp:Transcript_6755/g.10685  ORF Transcript_6755/g.10685 Transcript_6755/m.10685 type:complete len:354 (-) Transcript_6755:158-1219(-)